MCNRAIPCACPGKATPSTELGNRGREAHAHEEPREGLRKVFQERRFQPPTRPESSRVIRQVIVGQAVDLTKIDHKSLKIVLRYGRRGEQVQALDPTFQDLIPAPLAGEGGIDSLEFREGEDRAARHEPDLPLLQVATLRDNNQIALIGPDFVRLHVVKLCFWLSFGPNAVRPRPTVKPKNGK